MSRIFNQLLNVKGTVVEDARIADSPLRPEPVLEIRVRPRAGMLRCSRCGERWHGYDQGGGARRWLREHELFLSQVPRRLRLHAGKIPWMSKTERAFSYRYATPKYCVSCFVSSTQVGGWPSGRFLPRLGLGIKKCQPADVLGRKEGSNAAPPRLGRPGARDTQLST